MRRICPHGVNPSDQRAGCSGNNTLKTLKRLLILSLFSFSPLQPANAQSLKVDSLGISFVMTASRDKTIKLWDALRGQCLWTFVSRLPFLDLHFLTNCVFDRSVMMVGFRPWRFTLAENSFFQWRMIILCEYGIWKQDDAWERVRFPF